MQPLIAFLDANVLYVAGLRDLLIRLALHDLFQIRWSDQVHEEWIRNLLANRIDLTREKLERTYRLMVDATPNSLVQGYESLIESITLPDPGDRHVLAAAITGGARLIVTFNVSDFPQQRLRPYGIEAWHPDTFVGYLLDTNPKSVCVAIKQHRAALKNPPKTATEYLTDRVQDGLTVTAARLHEYEALL